jgi:hypothetical protein
MRTSETPKKKPRGCALSPEEKRENRRISRERIQIKNINAKINVFKITSSKYHKRRRRFRPRVSLICGIINFKK